ncbi:hypothetical protein EPO14_03840 [Patescibacteria group bacterium]|nr:MAG: hypothetical protein EPO14_03840 [Patescibacteria group bacterium]
MIESTPILSRDRGTLLRHDRGIGEDFRNPGIDSRTGRVFPPIKASDWLGRFFAEAHLPIPEIWKREIEAQWWGGGRK